MYNNFLTNVLICPFTFLHDGATVLPRINNREAPLLRLRDSEQLWKWNKSFIT